LTPTAEYHGLEIAIVGLAGRFPGAPDADALWHNVAAGIESIRFFTDRELLDAGFPAAAIGRPELVKAHGALDGVELFDAEFFGFHPREAEITDPQHRLFLECAWEAMENAGYDPERPSRDGREEVDVGVYAGAGVSSYLLWNLASRPELVAMLGSDQIRLGNRPDNLATRVAYKLGLRGPAVTVQTVCSTSLVATHLACQALINGECDLALAGGVAITVPTRNGYFYQPGGLLSPDGHCRPFDARAEGIVTGSGLGVVVLKRLEDALADGDRIRAVVKGSAINNDGALRAGFTAPGIQGQTRALRRAQAAAEIDPRTVTYVETHGTATPIGDPIEIAALTAAYDGSGERAGEASCAIGSIKSNIGHLDAAAGVAGLIKTVLALEHRQIPPSLHFEQPNPEIDFAAGPFFVNTELRDWLSEDGPRRAAVSSFGIGGTNAHVILEEAPPPPEPAPSRPWHLLILSARTSSALDTATENLAHHLERDPDQSLADVAATLLTGRTAFPHRRMLVCRDRQDALTALADGDPRRVLSRHHEAGGAPVCFLLPGLGEHTPGMAAELYRSEETFREHFDACADLLAEGFSIDPRTLLRLGDPPAAEHDADAAPDQKLSQGPDLRALLGRNPARSATPGELDRTAVAHPVVFSLEYALARLWMEWGLRPRALLGYSLGEYVAACLAGVLSLDDALHLVTERARAIDRLPEGAMLAVALSETDARERLGDELAVAAVNGPELTVVAGPEEAIETLAATLTDEGHVHRRLPVRHPFHTSALQPVTEELTRMASEIELRAPEIPYLSNVTGRWIDRDEATDPAYWSRHLCGTVRFADGLDQVLALSDDLVFLEVGPGQTLSSLVWQHPERKPGQVAFPTLPAPFERSSEVATALSALGRAWLAGAPVDGAGLYRHERRSRVPLPTYPFERRRFWIERKATGGGGEGSLSDAGQDVPPTAPAPPDGPTEVRLPVASAAHLRPDLLSNYAPPETPTERRIARIWEELLGLSRLGVHDSFFELGGSSLLAVQVSTRLSGDLGVELAPRALLATPTIAGLAARIDELGQGAGEARPKAGAPDFHESPDSPLVEVQQGDGRAPLFLFHPVGGHVVLYRPLATATDPRRTVYGLQARGLEAGEEPLTTLEEMTTLYLRAIRAAQPEGPYLLGGSSMGGTLAYEAARRLHAAGDTVSLLALFDTPGRGEMPRELEDDAAILAYLVGDAVPVTADELRRLDGDDQIRHVLALAADAGTLPPDFDAGQAHRLLKVFKANSMAMRAYDPAPQPGRLVFFRARERRAGDPAHPERSWIDLAEGGIEIHQVPGNHLTMFHHPHVVELGRRLRRCLEHGDPDGPQRTAPGPSPGPVPAPAPAPPSGPALEPPPGDDGPLPAHLIRLPGERWALWRHVCVRGAGFPFAGILELAAPESAAAGDAVLECEDRERALRRKVMERLAERLETTSGAERKRVVRALKRLDRGDPPGDLHLDGATDGGSDPQDRELAAALEAWAAIRTELSTARERYDELFRTERLRVSEALAKQCADPRFREAILWQNRQAFQTGIASLLHRDPDTLRLNSRQRQHEQLAASYLQRYSSKNDSIGFFGPVGWARLRDEPPTEIRPGKDLVSRREVFLEGWAVDALARALNRSLDRSETLEVPKVLEPERALARRLHDITDPEARAAALAKLERLTAARDAAARAAGDPDALDRALEELERTFEKLTGADATRAGGATYAGRTLLFEDCRRDLELDLGPENLVALGPPLSLFLMSCRWLTHRIATRCREIFQQTYDELSRATGAIEVPLLAFLQRVAPILLNTRQSPIHRELAPLFRRRWAEILPFHEGERRVSFSAEELRPLVEQAFSAPGPGWSLARHHSPDVLLAAAGPDAVRAGEALFVLGELHPGVNTLRLPIYAGHGLAPEDLFDGLTADVPEPAVVPVLPKTWSERDAQQRMGFTLPGTTARLDLGLVPSNDYHLELGFDPSGGPRTRTLAIGDLEVAQDGAALVVHTRDRRVRFDIVELFGLVLTMQTGLTGVALTPDGEHAPRITVDRLVVSRETWRAAAGELTFAAASNEANRLLEARRWARERDLPRHLFAKVPGEVKPLPVDLESPLSIEILARALRRAQRDDPEATVTLSEMLPGPDQLWLPDADGRLYTSELRFVAVDRSARTEGKR